jgi:hypothetical protein
MTISIRISRIALFAAALVLASTADARAQRRTEPLMLDSLSRVRVTQSAQERFGATFVSADSRVVVVERGGERLEIPRTSVRMLEVSQGPRPLESGAWRGAKRGFLGGALVGGVLAALVLATGEDDSYISNEAVATISLGVGVTAGTVLGTIVGAASPGERWVPVPIPSPAAAAQR